MVDVQGLYMSLVVVCSGRLFALFPLRLQKIFPRCKRHIDLAKCPHLNIASHFFLMGLGLKLS